MASDRDRKLIAILAALLQGGSSYFGAKSEQKEREQDRELELSRDRRADEYLNLQRDSVREAQRMREEDRAERTRTQANTANDQTIGRAATLGEARGYNRIEGTDSLPIARGSSPKSVASETIPLVTGDDQIDIDLQRILSGIRKGGDVGSLSQAAGQADAQRGFLSSVRGAEQGRDIEGAVARQKALMPGQLDLARGQAAIAAEFRPPSGGGGPTYAQTQAEAREGVEGLAASLAEQGLNSQEIGGRLIVKFRDRDPLQLLRIAVDAARDARRASGGAFSGSPASPVMQEGRIQRQRAELGVQSPAQKEWDELAAAIEERGKDPVEELGPRPPR